ncbi:MAG: hypothetical protein U0935_20345 [Pirellulales bacterium]
MQRDLAIRQLESDKVFAASFARSQGFEGNGKGDGGKAAGNTMFNGHSIRNRPNPQLLWGACERDGDRSPGR